MRLLLVTNIYPSPYLPAKGPFNFQIARELAVEHEVRVIAPVSWVDEWQARRKGQGRDVGPDRSGGSANLRVYYPRYYYTPRVLRSHYGKFLWWSVRQTLNRLLETFTPDAVLSYWIHPDGDVAVRIARRLGVPAVIMSGGSDALLLTQDTGRRRKIGQVLRRADAVVAVSRDLKDKLAALGAAEEKLHVVYRGVDTTRFSPGDRSEARRKLGIPPDERAVVWVGRMVPVKALDVLIDAMALLGGRGNGCRLHLVGDGPLMGSIRERAAAKGVSDRVRFVGGVAHGDLADWYRAANLTVLPSLSEGVPNVLRESLACGTPFVASRVGGILEISGGPENRLVPPGDAAALADAIEQSLARPPQSVNSVSVGWAQSAEELLSVIRPLVAARSAGSDRPTTPVVQGACR